MNDLTPRVIGRHRTIPLCFEQTRFGPIRVIRRIYQLILMGRRAPKQPYLYSRLAFYNSYGFRIPTTNTLSAGDKLLIQLEIGESATHLLRSARYSAVGREIMLAIATTKSTGNKFKRRLRCVYVRLPARIPPPRDDGLRDSQIIWDVISPSKIGSSAESYERLESVPSDAIRLYPSGQLSTWSPGIIDSSRPRFKGEAILYEYGSTAFRGSIALFIKSLVIIAIMVSTVWNEDLLLEILNRNWVLAVAAIAATVALICYCARRLTSYNLRRHRPAMFGVALPARMIDPRISIECLNQGDPEQNPLRLRWHGSSRRSLAIGDHCRNVAWSRRPF